MSRPWTNRQVERRTCTIEDATVKRSRYDSHAQRRGHLQLFVDAYNHTRRRETLRGLTPCAFICQVWRKAPERSAPDPSHHVPGP